MFLFINLLRVLIIIQNSHLYVILCSCNRNDFKREPCKLCPLKGCTISLGDNPDTFLIKHPDQSKSCPISMFELLMNFNTIENFRFSGNTYKFRADSESTALQWYRRLYHAAQSIHQPDTKLPDNLISFDWLVFNNSCEIFFT